jgi:hypothetical protein
MPVFPRAVVFKFVPRFSLLFRRSGFQTYYLFPKDAFPVPSPFPTLTSLDSAFQLQEYISLLIRLDIHDVKRIITIPGKNDDNESKSESGSSSDISGLSGGSNEDEKAADEHCWIYEQLR